MSGYRVTHIDAARCKRVLDLLAACTEEAMAAANRLYGEGWAVSAMRTTGARRCD